MGVHGSCWIRAAEDPGRSPKRDLRDAGSSPRSRPPRARSAPDPSLRPPTPLPAPGLLGDAAAKMALAASAAA